MSYLPKNYVLIQYGEYGFLHNKYAYAVVKSNLGSTYVNLGKITTLNLDKLNEATWNTASLKLHSEVYFRFFKPLEKYIPKKVKKVLITKSPFLDKVNLESLLTDSVISKMNRSFLLYKYPIFTQPSFRLFSEKSNRKIRTVNTIFPNYLESKTLSNIHFTKAVFTNWIVKTQLKSIQSPNENADLRLIAAHASSGSHRVDQAFLDKGLSKLSIRRICKRRTRNNLTILAVCDGGVGQSISSGSSFSIASAYLFSGASSCVYSNSVLDDKVGAEILADFLERLKNGEMKDWALRNAKLTYLKHVTSEEGYNPIYWAGLQVMGDVSPVEIGNQTNAWLWFSLLMLFIFIGLVFRQRYRLSRKRT